MKNDRKCVQKCEVKIMWEIPFLTLYCFNVCCSKPRIISLLSKVQQPFCLTVYDFFKYYHAWFIGGWLSGNCLKQFQNKSEIFAAVVHENRSIRRISMPSTRTQCVEYKHSNGSKSCLKPILWIGCHKIPPTQTNKHTKKLKRKQSNKEKGGATKERRIEEDKKRKKKPVKQEKNRNE